MAPLFLITGPPAAGKSTVCEALLARYAFAFHVRVDELRTWVVSGLSESVEWTDETERQFQIAEEAACDLALRYWQAGFAVAIDHCRNLPRLETLVQARLAEPLAAGALVRACLLPALETNLARNHARTNKDFDPRELDPIIEGMNPYYREATPPEGWLVLDTTSLTVEETVDILLAAKEPFTQAPRT